MKLNGLVLGTALIVGPVAAQEAAFPSAKPKLSAIIAELEVQGYRISEVDVDRDTIEIEALTSDGRRAELRVDAASGEVLSVASDD